ncbi:hypothetical protein ACFO25_19230 [Paenactinomyces guangxiensis]|uniref:Uncharacterized protein n=1 Tax=Paenactinomyces guangxiensis TaxID=1490290 RepID=A0A7W1WSW2_9BACL|nr:hypothetical protein [Paenactinomyces guangxiensis]MBA4495444.1 hypothetical protein [Paenactinomyces guangxiensis]MBH8592433.1 hypothetical protein [Paenactinomyces guangxiensis]
MFAVLADVRNEAGIEPIDYPRGLPSDVSSLIREEYQTFKDECCEGEVHSASWFTLKELLEFEWDKEVIHKGVVCEDTYRDLRESGCLIPSYFYRWVEGVHNDVLLSMDQMNDILDGKTERNPEVEYSVEMTWMESHASKCSNFIYAMKKLTELSDSGDLSDVRIVFWFDN